MRLLTICVSPSEPMTKIGGISPCTMPRGKRDYYCQSRRGNRLFELGLSEVGLALCAASSKTDQTRIADLVAEHGQEGFLAAWLRDRGVEWAAELIPDLTNLIPQTEKES
ncbi:type IV secretion system protein VirB4 [Gemmobacter caeni]|uniref:Uncharacterized protein n=1 Tax=Gemmobacter caeni TaxID=589035 RepID=A0A2T6A3L9_9RHOB|nr:hypothetical protein C8N34_1433 [Gemmobacter caeni]TWI89788.1 type IV secretion system protein VirB4 [Gemmobacter caeni]